jgi:hypothetical protein
MCLPVIGVVTILSSQNMLTISVQPVDKELVAVRVYNSSIMEREPMGEVIPLRRPINTAELALNGLRASVAGGFMSEESSKKIHVHYFPEYYGVNTTATDPYLPPDAA